MGQWVHRMGRSTTRTEGALRMVLVDNAPCTSDFRELSVWACALALRLQYKQDGGWPHGSRLNQGVLT